ncbi:MAG: hypothetical protein QF662_03690, partial [Phycisphaerae bacterium]|nr:hypothetical protein [Phycisphaerae bacterium]
SETVLDAKREGGSVEFRTPAGPSLIQLAGAETIVESILARVEEMFESQKLQARMDAKFGLGYQRRPWYTPDDVPGVDDETEIGEPLRPWEPFCQGYVIDLKTKKSGAGSLRTGGRAYTVYAGQWAYHNRQGAGQFAMVNQEKPVPLILTAYSKAEGVPKSELKAINDANRRDHFGARLGHFYAMHLYLDYQDGEWPEVHTFAFSPGTHDWEEGRITVTPRGAVKTAMVLLELHQPGGTAWFDEISLVEESNPEKNLLACGDFSDDDVKLAEAKARDYEKKVDQLLTAVKKARGKIGKDGLEGLAEQLRALKGWLGREGVARMYGRQVRDLADAQSKINLCLKLLAD